MCMASCIKSFSRGAEGVSPLLLPPLILLLPISSLSSATAAVDRMLSAASSVSSVAGTRRGARGPRPGSVDYNRDVRGRMSSLLLGACLLFTLVHKMLHPWSDSDPVQEDQNRF